MHVVGPSLLGNRMPAGGGPPALASYEPGRVSNRPRLMVTETTALRLGSHDGNGAEISPWMNAPVPASIKKSAVVAGDGHGCGVAVYGPHEGGWKVPEGRTAEAGVSAAATTPPPASTPSVESVTESTLTVVDDPTCLIAVAAAASAEIAAALVATVRPDVEAGPRPTQPTGSTITRMGTEARISAPSWNVFCTDARSILRVPVASRNGLCAACAGPSAAALRATSRTGEAAALATPEMPCPVRRACGARSTWCWRHLSAIGGPFIASLSVRPSIRARWIGLAGPEQPLLSGERAGHAHLTGRWPWPGSPSE